MILPSVLTVGIGLAFAWVWWQTARRSLPEAEFFHCWCEECGQKIRYAQAKAGRPGGCPRCKHRWMLPTVPQLVPSSPPRLRVGSVQQRHAG